MARRAGTSGTEELGTNGGLIFGKREPARSLLAVVQPLTTTAARSRSHRKVRVYKTDPDHLEHLVYRNTVSGTHRSQFVARTILSSNLRIIRIVKRKRKKKINL